MKRIVCSFAFGALFGLCIFAQDTPKADFFAGYSYLRSNPAQGGPAGNLNGGLGTFAYNLNKNFALAGEFGAHHNNAEFDTTTATYLFGPRVSFGREKKFDPFFHTLFGGAYSASSIDATSALVPQPNPNPVPASGRYSSSQNNFAMAIGGGVDVKMGRSMFVRLGQIDYLMTRFEAPAYMDPTGATSNRNQNNFRFSAGIGFNFGAR
jgi:opacity protein-like surface antigen